MVETKEGLDRPAVEIGWFGVIGGGGRRRPGVIGWRWVSRLQLTHRETERVRIGNRFFSFYFLFF